MQPVRRRLLNLLTILSLLLCAGLLVLRLGFFGGAAVTVTRAKTCTNASGLTRASATEICCLVARVFNPCS